MRKTKNLMIMIEKYDVVIVGGGAAGFYSAICAKEARSDIQVAILEKNAALLTKVKVSGGGRCNVTHHCYDPKELIKNYPRGEKELLGPFYTFQPLDIIKWFNQKGISIVEEPDGRMFPSTNCSQTIIDCFLKTAQDLGIQVLTKQKILSIEKDSDLFKIEIQKNQSITCKKLVLATGSSSKGHLWAHSFGHTIIDPVPSLFTFNVPSSPLKDLSGLSFKNATVQINDSQFLQKGPLLITHFGFSGPAVLKLSAWAARWLFLKQYQFTISINWVGKLSNIIKNELITLKKEKPSKWLLSENPFALPKSFWKKCLEMLNLTEIRLNDIKPKQIEQLVNKLCHDPYTINGKTTHKEEFVTCGGVSLKEINFKKMESKICSNLYFAGEILDIDGITGGFNFQNAWTSGYIAGSSCVRN